jgi:hypothetical protein
MTRLELIPLHCRDLCGCRVQAGFLEPAAQMSCKLSCDLVGMHVTSSAVSRQPVCMYHAVLAALAHGGSSCGLHAVLDCSSCALLRAACRLLRLHAAG